MVTEKCTYVAKIRIAKKKSTEIMYEKRREKWNSSIELSNGKKIPFFSKRLGKIKM